MSSLAVPRASLPQTLQTDMPAITIYINPKI
jgi:hypothetical protein